MKHKKLTWFWYFGLFLQWGWRCRAKLAVRGSSTNPLIGLYEEGTHNVIDIPECKGLEFHYIYFSPFGKCVRFTTLLML